MASWHVFAGWLAGALTLAAFVPYVIAILRRETRPNRVSWFIWALVCALTAVAYHSSGAQETEFVAFAYAGVCVGVALLSLKYGEGGSTFFDWFCVAGAFVSLVPWLLLQSPELTLYCLILMDCFAVLPTLRKAYLDPKHEDRLAWTISSVAMLVNLAAIDEWTLRIALYPIYCVVAVGAVALTLHIRKHVDDPRVPRIRPGPA